MQAQSQTAQPVKVLLVCRDIETIDTFFRYLQVIPVHVETACDNASALRKLCHGKYEGIVVDVVNQENGLELLKQVRLSTSHKNIVAFAMLTQNESRAEVFQAGANFILELPLTKLMVFRTFRAAYSMMVREKRHNCRCLSTTRVRVRTAAEPEYWATSINISETGMAVASPSPLRDGQQVCLCFELAGAGEVEITGRVCWADDSGRAGIEFLSATKRNAERLHRWLDAQVQKLIPAFPAELATTR